MPLFPDDIPYATGKRKYDLHTMWGRTLFWAENINPLLMLENKESLATKEDHLNKCAKTGKLPEGVTDAEMWNAKRAVEQCVHPTTGEVIPPFFRMSAFLPMNYFIVPFMMLPGTVSSVWRSLGIQWFNQSYNSMVNYANRSSDAQPVSEIAKAYTAAVAVACSGAMGATALINRVPPGTTTANLIRATCPFAAVCCAAIVNLAFMRKSEWTSGGKGIRVRDEDGETRGYSTAAGRDSLLKCSATRVIWNVPSMILPTLVMIPLCAMSPRIRRRAVPIECVLQCVGLTIGVPPALAVFDINQSISASALEPQFQGLKRKNGEPVKEFTYYKGL